MSKVLEALKQFKNMIDSLSLESIEIIEQALTPPTAEQLCEELGDYLKEPVWLDDKKDLRISTQWLVKQIYYNNEYKGLNFQVVLPPHLITLIGRFYEGKVKE